MAADIRILKGKKKYMLLLKTNRNFFIHLHFFVLTFNACPIFFGQQFYCWPWWGFVFFKGDKTFWFVKSQINVSILIQII